MWKDEVRALGTLEVSNTNICGGNYDVSSEASNLNASGKVSKFCDAAAVQE